MSLINGDLVREFLRNPDHVDLSKATNNELSDKALELLSGYEGELDLSGLTKLSDAAAEALAKHEGEGLHGILYLAPNELSDNAAEALAKHKGSISIDVEMISDAAAESISKHQGELLFLDSLTELSDASAKSLSKYNGEINGMDPEEWTDSLRQ